MADPTALYSYQGQEPAPLPEKILLSDGRKRTDISTFTAKEIKDAGFTGPYTVPSFDQEYQRVYWNSENLSFVVEDISEEELWKRIREKRNILLSECDWTMAADAPEDLNFHEWEMYRQRLRDLPSFYNHPKDVIFPISPEGRPDSDFDQPRIYEDRILWRVRDLENLVKNIKTSVNSLNYRVYKPFPSWNWNETEEKWQSPIDIPSDYDGYNYTWDEDNQEWTSVQI